MPDRIWVAFCGNGSLALDWLPLITHNENAGNAFLLIDYPGYGKSEGWASIANTRSAADAAVAALTRRLGVSETALEPRLATIGHSLGAPAALDFAAHHQQVRVVILLAPFTSLHEEAAIFIGGPFSRLFPDNYDNPVALHGIAQRQPPPRIVIFHGSEDDLIPPWMGRELATEYPGFVTFRGVPSANHDTVIAAAQDEILAVVRQGQVQRRAP